MYFPDVDEVPKLAQAKTLAELEEGAAQAEAWRIKRDRRYGLSVSLFMITASVGFLLLVKDGRLSALLKYSYWAAQAAAGVFWFGEMNFIRIAAYNARLYADALKLKRETSGSVPERSAMADEALVSQG